MSQTYSCPTFEFLFPDGWEVAESQSREGLTVNLQSPYSMFVFVNCYNREMKPEALADQALKTMAEEYDELDSVPISESIAGRPAVGHDVNFFSLDLTNTCWIRTFNSGRHSILIFAQANDLDLQQSELAFRGICASLKLNTDRAG